jgi:hypothetical protein
MHIILEQITLDCIEELRNKMTNGQKFDEEEIMFPVKDFLRLHQKLVRFGYASINNILQIQLCKIVN